MARTILCIAAFLYNSSQQYQVHRYLASLREYRVPDHPIFTKTNLVCPHYGCEVNIYLTLAILAARDTRIFNITMLCAVLFVMVNLGVTAEMTKQWQMQQFSKQRSEVVKRKRMIGSLW